MFAIYVRFPVFSSYCFFTRFLPNRASIEPNFHDLYLKFLDKVDSKLLFKEILQNTYENCKVNISSHKRFASMSLLFA